MKRFTLSGEDVMEQRIIISRQLNRELATALSECEHDKLFVLTDENTLEKCWPALSHYFTLKDAHVITIPAGDTHKDLESLTHVWQSMGEQGGTRHSCLINLGGGMVTDLGGFAASSFKRGLNFINIPTTLLAMVDASVGGKTGINFGGLKNEIGAFKKSRFVILDTDFLATLDTENMLSGYAEMLKHSLLATEEMWAEHLSFDIAANSHTGNATSDNTQEPDYFFEQLSELVRQNVEVKERIVTEDPNEYGIRKALNLGHTFGHAFESWSMLRKPILHGYAVAFGLICELYLSTIKCGFPIDKMRQTVNFIREYYGRLSITCDDYGDLIQLMMHDKKNMSGIINFTLLGGIGDIRINQTATVDEIKEALDFLREG